MLFKCFLYLDRSKIRLAFCFQQVQEIPCSSLALEMFAPSFRVSLNQMIVQVCECIGAPCF